MQQLRACAIELQDFEHGLDPRLPTGSDIADEYVPQMLMRCKSCNGKIFLAEIDGDIAGYVTILTKVSSGELEDAWPRISIANQRVCDAVAQSARTSEIVEIE